MLEILERIVAGQGTMEDLDTLRDLADMIENTALCGLGKSAPKPGSSGRTWSSPCTWRGRCCTPEAWSRRRRDSGGPECGPHTRPGRR